MFALIGQPDYILENIGIVTLAIGLRRRDGVLVV